MAKNLSDKEINEKLEKLTDSKLYNQILLEFFKKGIKTRNEVLTKELGFPELSDKEIEKNIEQNVKTLIKHLYKIPENSDLYKSFSCIFGSFLGDSLGSFCEFKPPNRNNYQKINAGTNVFGSEKGMATDDSEMAMSLAYAIMDTPEKDKLNSDFISYYYGLWFCSGPDDIGTATENALKNFTPNSYTLLENNKIFFNSIIKRKIKEANGNSLANGFLMRKSVFFVWIYYRFKNEIKKAFENDKNPKELYKLFQKIKDLSKSDDECTHPNPESSSATAYVTLLAIAAFFLKHEEIIKLISDFAEHVKKNPESKEDKEVAEFILDTLEQYKKNEDKNYYDYFVLSSSKTGVFDKMGWYRHSVRLILYYLRYYDKVNNGEDVFHEIVNQICNLGGDTDTNAAIVGSVFGPLVGFKSFAKDLKAMLEKGRKAYYPIFMVLYLEYLQKNIDSDKKNVLKMIVTIIYGRIDEESLSK